MKEKVEQNLYFVEKILRIEQVNGQKYAVVKWENYSYKQTTRESLGSLKINPLLCADIQRLEAQYETRHQTKAIAHQISQYTDHYLHQIYEEKTSSVKQSIAAIKDDKIEGKEQQRKIQFQVKKQSIKQKSQLTPQQLVICNIKAKNSVKERIKHGIGNFGPTHYFQLSEILYDLSQKLRTTHPQDLPSTDLVVSEIKGVYQQNKSYQFCVCLDSKVIIVPLDQMLEIFPKNLYNFLIKFLRYMQEKMQQQIRKEKQLITSKRYKMKAIEAVSKLLNIREHIQSHKKMVYFGRNQQDVEVTIKLHQQRFKGENSRADQASFSSDKLKSKNGNHMQVSAQSVNLSEDLKTLYNQVENQIDIIQRQNSGVYQRPKSHQTKSAKSNRVKRNGSKSSEVQSTSKKSKSESRNKNIQAEYSSNSIEQLKKSQKQVATRGKKINQSYPTDNQLRRSSRISSKSSNTVKSYSNDQQYEDEESKKIEKKGRKGGSETSNKCLKRKGQDEEQQWGRKRKVFKKN